MKPDQVKEIPREVCCPSLTDRAELLLTDLCFAPLVGVSPHGGFQALLVFGTGRTDIQHLCAKKVSEIASARRPSKIYLTGGVTGDNKISEARSVYEKIERQPLSGIEFVLDERSMCTRTNVVEALKAGLIRDSNVAFICKAGHYGRALLTLRKHILRAMNVVAGYEYNFPFLSVGQGMIMMTRQTWMKNPRSRARVWAEFLRIEAYGLRGDIEYPDSVREDVLEIRRLTNTLPDLDEGSGED